MPMRRLFHHGRPFLKALHNATTGTEVGARLLAGRHSLEREGQFGQSARCRSGIDGECVPVDVVQVVAGLVVARIVRCAGARVQRRRRDAELDEADKIGAGAESSGRVCQQDLNGGLVMEIAHTRGSRSSPWSQDTPRATAARSRCCCCSRYQTRAAESRSCRS